MNEVTRTTVHYFAQAVPTPLFKIFLPIMLGTALTYMSRRKT